MHIVGCVAAKELTTCKTGANQHAHILMRKNVVPTEKNGPESGALNDQPTSETEPMSIAAMKRIAAMNDVTKSHFAALDDTAAEAFLKKSVEDQDKEAADAKTAAEEKAKAAEIEKSGKSEREVALEKSLEATNGELAEIKKKLADDAEERSIEKTARSAEFAGYPGGEAALVPLLKTANKIEDKDARQAYIDSLKAQAASAKRLGTTFGARTEDEIAKSAPVLADVAKKANTLIEATPTMSFPEAQAAVFKANPVLLVEALAEERALQAA